MVYDARLEFGSVAFSERFGGGCAVVEVSVDGFFFVFVGAGEIVGYGVDAKGGASCGSVVGVYFFVF